MKKYIIVAIALLASVCTSFAEDEMLTLYRVVITDTNNSKVSFDFDVNPEITFKDNYLTVELDSQNVIFMFDNVRNITFSSYKVKKPDDGVEGINSDNQTGLAAIGNQLIATGMQEGGNVSIYTVDGRIVLTALAGSNGNAVIDLSSFAAGVYIAKAGNVTLKFIK